MHDFLLLVATMARPTNPAWLFSCGHLDCNADVNTIGTTVPSFICTQPQHVQFNLQPVCHKIPTRPKLVSFLVARPTNCWTAVSSSPTKDFITSAVVVLCWRHSSPAYHSGRSSLRRRDIVTPLYRRSMLPSAFRFRRQSAPRTEFADSWTLCCASFLL